MKRHFGLAAVLAFSGLALLACSGSTTGGTTSAGPVPREQFASQFAHAICDNIGGCCQQSGVPHDPAACVQVLEPLYAQLFGSYKSQYDAAKGGECVAYAANLAKSCTPNPPPGPCDDVSVGTVPNGGQCQYSADCIRPPNGDVSCNDGVCEQEPRGKLGDGCSGTCTEYGNSTSCSGGSGGTSGSGPAVCYTNDGLQCGSSGTCEALAALGAACQYGGCVAEAYCDWSAQKCVPRVTIGGSCTDTEDCVDGAFCDSTSKCAALLANGAACSSDSDCLSDACVADKCGAGGLSVFCSSNINN